MICYFTIFIAVAGVDSSQWASPVLCLQRTVQVQMPLCCKVAFKIVRVPTKLWFLANL